MLVRLIMAIMSYSVGRFDSGVTSIVGVSEPALRADCRITTSSWRSTSVLIEVGKPRNSCILSTAIASAVALLASGTIERS